jgi:hypothetical protein
MPYTKVVEFDLRPERSGWIAAQVLYRNKGNGQYRQAHTSPLYFLVDNKPIAFRKDAEMMIEWVDKLIEINRTSRAYHSDHERDSILKIYEKAREIYSEISRKAEDIWKD